MRCTECNNHEMTLGQEESVRTINCPSCGHKLYLSEYSPRQAKINFLLNERYAVTSEFMRISQEQSQSYGKDAVTPEFEEGRKKVEVIDGMLKNLGYIIK